MLFQTCCVPELNHLGSPSHNLNLYTMQCKLSQRYVKGNFHSKTVTCKNAVHVDKTFWNFLIDIQTLTYIIPLSLIVG